MRSNGFLIEWRQQDPRGLVTAFVRLPQNQEVPVQRRPPEKISVAGKGGSLDEARAAARGEAAERYSLVFQGNEPSLQASLASVRDQAIGLSDLLQFSDEQYALRDQWNRGTYGFPYIPPRCPEDHPISWTPAYSLREDSAVLIPTQHCYLSSARHGEILFAIADTNGCAAGPTLEFALENAILELIERDGIARWWLTRARVPAMNLPASSEAQAIADLFHRDNRAVHLLNLTTELGIPVFAATAYDRSSGKRISLGFGAGRCTEQAAMRALRELQQGFSQPEVDPEQEEPNSMGRAHAVWVCQASAETDSYIVPGQAPAQPAILPCAGLPALIQRLKEAQMDVYVVDVTRPETGVPVLRAICPQLRPPHHRLRGHAISEVNPAPFAL